MKRRGRAALIAALAVVAVGIVVSYFLSLSFNRQEQYTITLPGQGTATIAETQPIREENQAIIQAVTITGENVQAVIEQLRRPEVYQLVYDVTYFYGDNQTSFQSTVSCGEGVLSDRVLRADGSQASQALVTEKWIYLFDDSGGYRRFPHNADDEDLYACTPTFEDLTDLPREAILDGAVEELDGHLCLSVTSRNAVTGERQYWRILSDTGLLFSMRAEVGGKPVYQAQLRSLSLDPPDASLFRLPGGESPE